jgi:flagellar motor component MotA
MRAAAVLGLTVTLGIVVMAMALGAPMLLFFDELSFLLVIVGTGVASILVHGPRSISRVLVGGYARMLAPVRFSAWGAEECREVLRCVHSAGAISALLAGAGALIGLVQMLSTMDDPSRIGPAMAMVLMSLMYGLTLNLFIFVPMSGYYARRVVDTDGAA